VKIAILSDIHSAADHFRDALNDARDEGFDQLLILGDLFTYGPAPAPTLELVQQAISTDAAILIKGNHDLLYGRQAGGNPYSSRLPDWIRESVEWTAQQLGEGSGVDALPWCEEWTHGKTLFAHANPFGFGDWTYLADNAKMAAAWAKLQERKLDWGIFGHVHRFRRFEPANAAGGIATVGSIGQPRDKAEPFSQWAMMTATDTIEIEQRRVPRDWRSTVEAIQATSMADATKTRLCEFYQ
jgi:predicted phosphodiesterase